MDNVIEKEVGAYHCRAQKDRTPQRGIRLQASFGKDGRVAPCEERATGRNERNRGANMNDSAKTIAQMKKATKLVRLAQRKNGPKSYKRGQGALLRVLLENDGMTQRDLVAKLGLSRGALKDVVRKAQRNDYVVIQKTGEKKTYAVSLTDEGRKVAKKHEDAQDKAADEILSALSAEERAQLDAITEKIIVACKESGIDGKKKGRKVHRKGGKRCAHRHGHRR